MANFLHSTTGAYFKRKYEPKIRDQFNHTTPGLGFLNKTHRGDWAGQGVFLAARNERNPSYRPTSAGRQGAAFPGTGSAQFANFVVPVVLMHGSGGISALAAAASSPEGAFGDALRDQVQLHLQDSKQSLEYDFYRGPTGILGRLIADPGAGNVFGCEQSATQQEYWRGDGNRWAMPNQEVEIFSADGVTRRVDAGAGTFYTVQSVATANRREFTATTNAGGTEVVGDLVVRRNTFAAQADPGAGSEAAFALNGLEQIISDTTEMPVRGVSLNYELDVLQGIDRGVATNSWSHSYVRDLNSAVIDRNTFNQVIRIVERRGDVPVELILCSDEVQFELVDLMANDVLFQPQSFPGGFRADALVWNAGNHNAAVLATRQCPHRRAYLLNLDCVEVMTLVDFEIIETDGSLLRQDAGGGDVWNWNWRFFANMASRQPNGLGKVIRFGGVDEGLGETGRLYDQ